VQDFATRSLKISEETPEKRLRRDHVTSLEDYALKRKWETEYVLLILIFVNFTKPFEFSLIIHLMKLFG
jgi:hypothetical protein